VDILMLPRINDLDDLINPRHLDTWNKDIWDEFPGD
jgi:hypothetical protein